jgi:hypothetical protein
MTEQDKRELHKDCLQLFTDTACKQNYEMEKGILAVVEYVLNQVVKLPIDIVSGMFAYHPENEEVGRVFRNTITNKWYYDEGLAEIIGWSNVEKLKET